MIGDSINRVDLDLRKSLFSNVVLSGGSTLCRGTNTLLRFPLITLSRKGFGDRLLNEVKKLAMKDMKIKIYAPPERKYSTWIGGSILAGLNTFKKVSLNFSYQRPTLTPSRRCGCQRRNTKKTRISFTRSLASKTRDVLRA